MNETADWVVVSGAGAGIGKAIAAAFIARGDRVLGIDCDSLALADTCNALGGAFVPSLADVSRVSDLARAIAPIGGGNIRALVNNAAIVGAAPFEDLGAEQWEMVLGVNLLGPAHLIRTCLPHMAGDWARVVNISSHSAILGSYGRSAYAASKGGLEALTRVLAVELAPRRITVNCVAPGPVDTPHSRQTHSQDRRDAWAQRLPLARYAVPAEVTSAVTFLCSADAGFITGQTLGVDGGFSVAGITQTI